MADSPTVDNGSLTDYVVSADEVTVTGQGGAGQVQYVKLVDGTSNGTNPISGDATNGLDVDVTRVSGTVTVDSELPAAAAMSDTISRTLSTPQVGALLMIDNASNYVRAPGDVTNGLDVDITRLPASTNTIEVVGDVAQDAAVGGNPLLIGLRASAAVPSAMSADGDSVYAWATRSGAQVVAPVPGDTATLANVSGSASSVTLQAANTSRLGLVICNDSSAILYVKFGTTASTTSFTYKLAAGETLELPGAGVIYRGRVDGIWASATGSARMTELT